MDYIRVDVQRLRARVEPAQAAVNEAAEAVRIAAQQVAAAVAVQDEAVERLAAAERELDFAQGIEQAVIESSVPDDAIPPESVGSYSEPDKLADGTTDMASSVPAPVVAVSGPYFKLGSRQAVLEALRAHPGRTWALNDLVTFMKGNGFQGTHNAIHVQLSRLLGTPEAKDIERVKTGYYRSIPKNTEYPAVQYPAQSDVIQSSTNGVGSVPAEEGG